MNFDHRTTKQCLLILFLHLVLLLSPFIPLAGAQPSPDGRNEQYPYARFSPSMAIIIVVLIAALFFMGFFSIYIRHCSDTSGAGSIRGVAGAITGLSRRGPRGLDREVIDKFPTLVYSTVKGLKIGKGALECAVCLNEFEDEETLRLIPKCDHVFHPECIDAWLESHTTCPVCRANLVPESDESTDAPPELTAVSDIEAQNDAVEQVLEERIVDEQQLQSQLQEPEVLDRNKTLNRNRTRRSRSSRIRRLFPRSHSTGHSLVQPGENTERFTLRLPAEVRKQVFNRQLNRASSMLILPREGSSRVGNRTGGGEGSSRGKNSRRFERSDRATKSDRWVFTMAPPFLTRMSSLNSPKVAANDGEESQETSAQPFALGVERSGSVRPPV